MSEGRKRAPQAGQRLRGKVRGPDAENVRRVLESAGNFYHCEIDIAIDLLDDYRQSGNKSPYQFIFADCGKEFAGFICYGEIPLTEGRYDIWIGSYSPDDFITGTLRITETGWFRHEHDEVPAGIWKRPAVKSAANCAACHTRADAGDFSERNIRIPR